MAEGKDSFVLYRDQIHLFEDLSDREAGKLIKHIFRYVNDQNPETDDRLVNIAFTPIKQQLKRDLKKWDKYINKQRVNGSLGGRPQKPTETQKTQAFFQKPKKADNVNVNVNVNESTGDPPPESTNLTLSVFDAEASILANQIRFEQICMKTGIGQPAAKEALRKYHLYLAEKEQYPKSKQAVFAGFEKWLMNEKLFQPKTNGQQTDQNQPTGPKLKTI